MKAITSMKFLAISFAVLALLLSFRQVALAQSTIGPDAPCPVYDEPPQMIQGTVAPGSDGSVEVAIAPCHSLGIQFAATLSSTNGQPASVNFMISLMNWNGTEEALVSKTFTCLNTCSSELPPAAHNLGNPYHGTRGARGLAKRVRVRWTNSSGNVVSPAQFSVTLTKTRRKGYNLGGDSRDVAPTVVLPRMLKSSLHHWEAGQFYRILLDPGAPLKTSGVATCKDQTFACNLLIRVYNPRTGANTTILSTGIDVESTKAFSGTDYVNTASMQYDFYVQVSSGNQRPLYDLQLVLETNLLRRTLTLFLDADPTKIFDASEPLDHNSKYVPGTDIVIDGAGNPAQAETSVGMPTAGQPLQLLEAIAAYTTPFLDSMTAIVPPPSNELASFTVTDVSSYVGIAMNWPDSRPGENQADFSLSASEASFGTDGVARVGLQCWDFGGWVNIRVTHASQTADLRIPLASQGDAQLPMAGWKSAGVSITATTATVDEDGEPSTAWAGDGLTALQEYRGFIVNGVHLRTSPMVKDYFLTFLPGYDIGYAEDLPLRVHKIRGAAEYPGAEEYSADRLINANRENSTGPSIPGADQAAVVLYSISGPIGADGLACWIEWSYQECTMQVIPTITPPNRFIPTTVRGVFVWPDVHTDNLTVYCKQSYELNGATCPYSSAQIANEVYRTLGHEIGHTVGICHRGQCAPLDESTAPTSVMSTDYKGGPPPTHPASKYAQFDLDQIRLH